MPKAQNKMHGKLKFRFMHGYTYHIGKKCRHQHDIAALEKICNRIWIPEDVSMIYFLQIFSGVAIHTEDQTIRTIIVFVQV